MSIDNLPTGGYNFRLDKGHGNFAYKLYKNTRYGELHNLADNRESIVESLKPYTATIRRYGGLNRLQQKQVYKKILTKEGELSWDDRHDVKKVIKYLGRNKPAAVEKDNPFAPEEDKKAPARVSASGAASGAALTVRKKGLSGLLGARETVAPPRLRINRDVSNLPTRVNPYVHRLSRSGPERQLGIVSANSSSAKSVISRQEGGFVVPPPPGATPPPPISREAQSPESGRLRRVT